MSREESHLRKKSSKERILSQRTDQCVNTANLIPVMYSTVPPQWLSFQDSTSQTMPIIQTNNKTICCYEYIELCVLFVQISKSAFLVLAFNFPHFLYQLKSFVWYQAMHEVGIIFISIISLLKHQSSCVDISTANLYIYYLPYDF